MNSQALIWLVSGAFKIRHRTDLARVADRTNDRILFLLFIIRNHQPKNNRSGLFLPAGHLVDFWE